MIFSYFIFVLFFANIVCSRRETGSPITAWNETTLVDSRGAAVALRDLPERYKLVYFGYTHCPSICSAALASMNQAVLMLGARGRGIRPILISVDPDRDQPETLARYLEAYPGNLPRAFTGSPAAIQSLAGEFGVRFQPVTGGAERPYGVDHSLFIYLLGPENRLLGTYSAGLTGKALAEELARHLR